MSNPPRPTVGPTQSLTIGGDAAGIIQNAGDQNTITQTTTVTAGAPPEVINALAAIQAALAGNPAKVLADKASQQAKVEKPDKGAIATQLDAALTVAKTLPDWLEVVNKIGPHIATAAAWLGAQGASLLALLR